MRSTLLLAIALPILMAPENENGGGGGGGGGGAGGGQNQPPKQPEPKQKDHPDAQADKIQVWMEHPQTGHAFVDREHLPQWRKKGFLIVSDKEAAELTLNREKEIADAGKKAAAADSARAAKAAELAEIVRNDPAVAKALAVALGVVK